MIEKGYTQIPNEALESIVKMKLNATQFKIIMTIWRYTFGFQRKEHHLSLTFISTAIQADKRQVQREMDKLEEMNVITQSEKTNKKGRLISFNHSTIGESTNGESTIGESTIGESTNITIGESTNNTIGESTNQERKKKTINKISAENSQHKEIIKYFCDKHSEKTAIKYNFSSGKDGKLIQGLLKNNDAEFLKGCIDWFFQTEDAFITKAGYSIGILNSSLPKYIAQSGKLTQSKNNLQEVSTDELQQLLHR